MKQIQMEAWHLVNLHTLRCLENELPLSDYNSKTFFDHCCAGVSTTSQTCLIARKNPDLWESIKIYQSQRERTGLSEVDHLTGYSELKHELREQMVVNAGVMIREHFRKRLKLYVDITFGGLDSTLTKKQKKEKADLVKTIMRACYSVDETDIAEALQIRDVLMPGDTEWSEQWVPWPDRIKENGMAFYVRLLWEFQDVIEKRMEEIPNEKGVRAFSLFPVSTTYSRAHIKINGSTSAGFYSRIRQRVEGYRWALPNIALSVTSFQTNRWTVMRNAFDIARFETRLPGCPLTKTEFAQLPVEEKYKHASHLFANQVATDGYGASVLLCRPKTEAEKSGKKSIEGPVVPPGYTSDRKSSRHDIGEEDGNANRDVRSGGVDRRGRGRATGLTGYEGLRRRAIATVETSSALARASTVTWQGSTVFRAWNEGQKKRQPEYQMTIGEMPSFKTASYEQYLERLKYFWHHVEFLMQFCVNHPFLKWKFFQKRMTRVAVDEIARRIIPTVSRLTWVAYGDWSRRDGIKGHAPSPVKGLKEALRKRATVVSMDEFRTSKLCSQCHQTLPAVRYSVDTKLPKRKKCKGVVLVRNRAEVEFEDKKCHAVLRCGQENCEARYWDRDVNAAINMVDLLKSEVLGRGRMEPFRRS
ncbi:hypothetical protein PI124_g16749 [Phytophthora idaei]|nr:hypothetical protein PI124_g16749 [Phytophthora idaei]